MVYQLIIVYLIFAMAPEPTTFLMFIGKEGYGESCLLMMLERFDLEFGVAYAALTLLPCMVCHSRLSAP
jgi:hypothetical protein